MMETEFGTYLGCTKKYFERANPKCIFQDSLLQVAEQNWKVGGKLVRVVTGDDQRTRWRTLRKLTKLCCYFICFVASRRKCPSPERVTIAS